MSYNIPLNSSGDVDFARTMTAGFFVGDGSGLTNLPGGGGGNPFDQSLNTTDSPSFVGGTFSGTLNATVINDPTNTFVGLRVNGSEKFTVAGSYVRSWQDFIPTYDGTIELGRITNRWEKTWSVDGSFTGNLNTEVGGSQRVYNLGTDGDTDTEYLETSWDTNVLQIYAKNTGTGVERAIKFGSASTQIQAGGAANNIVFRTNGIYRAQITTTSLATNVDIYAATSGLDIGTSAYPFERVYSVKGYFDEFVNVGTDLTVLGDGSFAGTLDTEVGGSNRLFNLGSDADVAAGNTEYLDLTWLSDRGRITTQKTGSGVVRSLDVKSGNSYVQLNDSNDTVKIGTLAATFSVSNTYFNVNKNFYSTVTSSTCGLSTNRWGNVYSVDGSFSGNLDTEVGGSQRVFNLGSDADVAAGNTEYLETSWDTNVAKISSKSTGTGTLREVQLIGGNSSVELKTGLMYVKAGGFNLLRGSGAASTYLYSFSNGTILDVGDGVFEPFSANVDLGSTAKRWATVYGVDGNFSGTVTADAINTTGSNLVITNNGAAALQIGSSSRITAYYSVVPDNTGTKSSGLSSRRWSKTWSVDGSFSGNLDTEVGGSSRVFNLGSDADIAAGNTEYLETSWDTNVATISTKETGTGVSRGIAFAAKYCDINSTEANSLLSIQQSGLEQYSFRYNALLPKGASAKSLGVSAARWSSFYSVDGDFSGDVSAFKYRNDGTNNLVMDTSANMYFAVNGVLTYGFFNTVFQPQVDNSKSLGSATKRWQNAHFVISHTINTHITGKLDTEVGGINRIFNLGSDSDVAAGNSEYLETSWDTNVAWVEPKATGTGVARKLKLGNPVAVNVQTGGGGADLGGLNFGTSFKLIWGPSYVSVLTTFRPFTDAAYTNGDATHRWSDVYSVDGDFSGTVTAASVIGTGNLLLQNLTNTSSISLAGSGAVTITAFSAIYQQFTTLGVGYRKACYPIFNGSLDLGLETLRWGKTWSVDGSFSGTLDTEVGGEYRLFKLGSAADVAAGNTEYLSMRSDIVQSNESYVLEPVGTGTGTSARQFYIMGSNNRSLGHILLDRYGAVSLKYGNAVNLYVSNGYTRSGANFYPTTDNTYECGLATKRWATVYGVDGDFSGTVNLTGDIGVSSWRSDWTNDGAGNAEYVEGLWDGSNGFVIRTKYTGTGSYANTDLTLLGSISGINLHYVGASIFWGTNPGTTKCFVVANSYCTIGTGQNNLRGHNGLDLGKSATPNTYEFRDAFFIGTVTSGFFVGDGSGLTNLPAAGNPFDQSLDTTDSPTFVRSYIGDGVRATPSHTFASQTSMGMYKAATNQLGLVVLNKGLVIGTTYAQVGMSSSIGWRAADSIGSGLYDTMLNRDDAGIISQRSTIYGGSQAFRVYGDGDKTNGEWVQMDHGVTTANTATISSVANGTGVQRILEVAAPSVKIVNGNDTNYLQLTAGAGYNSTVYTRFGDLFLKSNGSVRLTHGGNNTKLSTSSTGVSVTGNVVTDSTFLINRTWNDAATVFQAFDANITDTASDANSNLINIKVGGVQKFRVKKDGAVTATSFTGDGSGLTGLPSGSSTLAGLTDTNVSSPANGHLLIYDAVSSKWDNALMTSSGNTISFTFGAGTINLEAGAPPADSIDSQHYVDGSIDTAHIGDDQVTAAKLANTAVTTGTYTNSTITVDAQGRLTAASSGSSGGGGVSDERLKDKIKNIEGSLEKILAMNPVEFDWLEGHEDVHGNSGKDIGFIAQEIEKIQPELVGSRKEYKTLQYDKFAPLIVGAIKELNDQIQEIKRRLS